MAVESNYNGNFSYFFGLSTETKPTIANIGSVYTETDTGNRYEFEGTGWTLQEKEAPIWLTDNTTTLNGVFTVVEAYGDCAFTTFTSNITKNGSVTALTPSDIGTLSDGKRIYGVITSIRLTSGKCICYR